LIVVGKLSEFFIIVSDYNKNFTANCFDKNKKASSIEEADKNFVGIFKRFSF